MAGGLACTSASGTLAGHTAPLTLIQCLFSLAGRAPAQKAGGRGFESHRRLSLSCMTPNIYCALLIPGNVSHNERPLSGRLVGYGVLSNSVARATHAIPEKCKRHFLQIFESATYCLFIAYDNHSAPSCSEYGNGDRIYRLFKVHSVCSLCEASARNYALRSPDHF